MMCRCTELELELEAFPAGTYKDKRFATLYFSDGKQMTVKPDEKTMKKLQTFFEDLICRIGTAD